MERKFPEADWKLFRQLQTLALDRFCQRVLGEVTQIISDSAPSNHARYLAVFRLLQRRAKELADAFDDPRRSQAFIHLAHIVHHHLLTEEELARFSAETRGVLQLFVEMGDS